MVAFIWRAPKEDNYDNGLPKNTIIIIIETKKVEVSSLGNAFLMRDYPLEVILTKKVIELVKKKERLPYAVEIVNSCSTN
jgi:hypothetical protein